MPAASSVTAPFATLAVAHRTRGRVRFRYRLAPGTTPGRALEHAVAALDGVLAARLNPAARALVVAFDPALTDADALHARLLTLAVPAADQDAGTAGALREVALAGALLVASPGLPPPLRLPATLSAAMPLFAGAWDDLQRDGLNSHVLEALAVGISTVRRDFGAANATLFMLALGEYLEHSIARRSDDLLRSLLRPDVGLVWIERDGVECRVDADSLRGGETVIVGAGATVPVDGTVLGGEALVNEAAMTGESTPVGKARGDRVLSGTAVEEGRLRIYAEHVGRATAVARIADYVEQSLASKSAAQLRTARLADRLVPLVLGLAGGTWLVSGDWQRTAAVLQADYACALKLATPVAFKAAMHRAGHAGILVKGADVLERLAEADTFVFDKTGTLTSGRLEVTDSITFDPEFTPDDLIFLAASVEEHYFHPLALAVVDAARMRHGHHFDHSEVQFIAAHGVASDIDGQRIVVGSRHFVEEDEGIPIAAGPRRRIERLYRQGKTLLYIGFGGRLLGVLALKDSVRDNAAATLARLRRLGARRIVMLTGDHRDRAAELAAELGLDAFHAGLLPEDKAALVAGMRDAGARVAFIGDGINDAPALAGAHVGIAMQRGADIARLTSDVALLEDDIALVADARELAHATLRRIDANFRLTVGINTSILAAAAFGALTPVAASVLHNGGTIGILLNALRATSRRRARRQPPARPS